MKKIVFLVILTLLATCGSVYCNPAIDALEQEIESLRSDLPNIGIEGLKRMSKLRDILHSLQRQEQDALILRQWEEERAKEPCRHLDRGTLLISECEKVKI